MQCPNCGSENTQSFQMVYESGARDIVSTSHSFGTGVGGGKLGGGAAVTVTEGTANTKLANRTAPPPYKGYSRHFMALVAAGMFQLGGFPKSALVVLLVTGISAALRYRYNKNEFPGLYAEWRKKWLCHKCGTTYQLEVQTSE